MTLTRCHLLALLAAGCLASQPLWAGAAPAPSGNPYAPIITRNVFALVPIPVNTAPEVPEDPPPKITPNGIMSIFGKLQVLFKVAVNVPGQAPKDESHVMGEGEREDDIEVQKIDDKNATVTFNNHGVIQELSLVSSSAAASAGAAPAANGFGRPGMPRLGMNRTPMGYGTPFSQAQNNPGISSPASAAPPVANSAPPAPATPAEPPMPLEQQIIMIEANRMVTQDQVTKGEMPPLPPTDITPSDATGIGGAPLVLPPPNSAGAGDAAPPSEPAPGPGE